jgi:hypothetical protein
MGKNGTQPSEVIIDFNRRIKQFAPGRFQKRIELALIRFPGKKVGNECNQQEQGTQQKKKSPNLFKPFIANDGKKSGAFFCRFTFGFGFDVFGCHFGEIKYRWVVERLSVIRDFLYEMAKKKNKKVLTLKIRFGNELLPGLNIF